MKKNARVRCPGIGVGVVDRIEQREMFGKIAVIVFPHNQVIVKYPVSDPAGRVSAPLNKTSVNKLLAEVKAGSGVLQRTWEQREAAGEKAIRNADPEECAQLLGAYAAVASNGTSISGIDREIVNTITGILAAEYWGSMGGRYSDAYRAVENAYQRASNNSLVTA